MLMTVTVVCMLYRRKLHLKDIICFIFWFHIPLNVTAGFTQ